MPKQLKLHSFIPLAISAILSLFFFACSSTKNFNASEKKIIENGLKTQPFRVTQITNPQDSVILRTVSKDLKKIKGNKSLELLLARMETTMYKEEGIGIAAPQIGINRNIFLFIRLDEPGEKVQVAINPKIIAHSDSLVCFKGDGCLSVPDKRGNSKRYSWIEVGYYDENGVYKQEKFSGYARPDNFTGVIFQHEFDHINGRLYIDKLCNP